MQLLTFNEILTKLCDDFDELISPRKISRSNTNIIYLLFKAIAKGYEVINSICVVLSHKFDPANCSDEDLVSVASLVGTERRAGSASGLRITITNYGEDAKVIRAGIYTYALDNEISFEFEVLSNVTLIPNQSVSYIAMSNQVGQFHVTAQESIEVTSEADIPTGVRFSCSDNIALQGTTEESLLDFRKRVLNVYDRQNSIVELEEYIRNLPYIFDCKIKYNQTEYDIVVDGITIPPMCCAIFYSGEAKNEIAEMIADYILCPTVSTADSVEVRYNDSVFADGYYAVNIIPFAKLQYTVDVVYRIDNEYVNTDKAKTEIENALYSNFVGETHKDYIKEDDIYGVLETLNIAGLSILAVNLKVDNNAVNFVSVPISRIPELVDVNFVVG